MQCVQWKKVDAGRRACGYRAAAFFFLRCDAVLCVVILHAKAACMRRMPVGHGITDSESTWWPTVSAMRAGALPGASEIPLGILKNWLALLAPADFSANLRARFHFNRGRCGLRRCGAAHFPGLPLLCGRPLPGLGSTFAPGLGVRLRCTTLVEVVVVPFAAASFALRALPFALPAGSKRSAQSVRGAVRQCSSQGSGLKADAVLCSCGGGLGTDHVGTACT